MGTSPFEGISPVAGKLLPPSKEEGDANGCVPWTTGTDPNGWCFCRISAVCDYGSSQPNILTDWYIGSDFWSVKFYPFTKPGVDPIFAVVGGKTVCVITNGSTEFANS